MSKKMGRPTVMTESVLLKIEQAASIGASDREACAHAGISEAPYYHYLSKNPDFKERIHILKEKLPLKAKSQLAKLIHDGDKDTVKWYLERKKKQEFSLRQEIDHTTDGESINTISVEYK